jgi:hypothetical protein
LKLTLLERHTSTVGAPARPRDGRPQLVPSRDPKHSTNAAKAVLDCLGAEEQSRCRLPGRSPLGQQLCDLRLLWRQLRDVRLVVQPNGLASGGELRTGHVAPRLGAKVVEDVDFRNSSRALTRCLRKRTVGKMSAGSFEVVKDTLGRQWLVNGSRDRL